MFLATICTQSNNVCIIIIIFRKQIFSYFFLLLFKLKTKNRLISIQKKKIRQINKGSYGIEYVNQVKWRKDKEKIHLEIKTFLNVSSSFVELKYGRNPMGYMEYKMKIAAEITCSCQYRVPNDRDFKVVREI